MNMNGEEIRIWKDTVMADLKVLFQNAPGQRITMKNLS
jgi:hypothetical protein